MLQTKLTKTLLHTTDNYIKSLEKWGIVSVWDMINLYPKDYEDRTNIIDTFSYINIKEKNVILVKLLTLTNEKTSNNKLLTKAVFEDKNGFLAEWVWFNRKYFSDKLQKFIWKKVIVSSKVKYAYWKVTFQSPEIETDLSKLWWEILPVYSDVNYIPGSWIWSKMYLLKDYFKYVKETLPEEIIKKYNFLEKNKALEKLHFPQSKDDIEIAKYRLAYEELFDINFKSISKKQESFKLSEWKSISIPLNPEFVKEIISELPFELTNHQKIALFQVLKDMENTHSMQRLLEWDVWTWKTIIAQIAMIHAILEWRKIGKNIQVAIMVPTEILARQHFESMFSLFLKYNISSNLLIWSLTKKQKDTIKIDLREGNLDVVIWTHALVQEDVLFKNLWFVVIDEQHRFWVKQREVLEKYVSNPNYWKYRFSSNITQDDFEEILKIIKTQEFNSFSIKIEDYSVMKDNEKNIIWFARLLDLWNWNFELGHVFIDEKYRHQKLWYELIKFTIKNKFETWNLFLSCNEKFAFYYKNLWFEQVEKYPEKFIATIEWALWEWHPYCIMQLKTRKYLDSFWIIPHNLNMTATPIPRTLALTLYWDQDLSIISEYPKNRKIIFTKVAKNNDERHQIELFIRSELDKWRQVFWISPLVEESEKIDLANAVNTFESLTEIFSPYRVWLLHWKMKASEKEEVMREFAENKIQVLSSTSVVEVWINIPNATIMCIEWAERFWLSQLHQFRWRVWRWEHKSYCYLFSTNWNSTDRLKAMEKTNNWFELAEIDLELRWPWEVYWVRQSGVPEFKIADIKDLELVSQIREDIEEMFKNKK